MKVARAAPWLAVGVVAVAVAAYAARRAREGAQCDDGFRAAGARCVVPERTCPAPLARRPDGVCDAPDVRVRVEAAKLTIGPSDWEAEGRVAPRTIETRAFAIDAFEATVGRYAGATEDAARAASGMTRDEAAAYCASRGGRLPTEDEWIAAASARREGNVPRYAWGDTGAVCRRGAWGLESGPCARGATGPDTVGAHASGDTPSGLHDMAGNVAEWVGAVAAETGVVRGGSWRTVLAPELRVWARREVEVGARDATIGVRCAYDAPR